MALLRNIMGGLEKDIFEKLMWVNINEAKKLSLAPNVKTIVKRLKEMDAS
ncbi:MAG: hypothetical protein Q8R47_05525 [Nanoarchaeota archaeon]|nr:hypothetical protein [Nanoarchaeota archaeon]